MNHGFGIKKEWPITIDVISKAQSLLASQMNQSISNCYEKLMRQYEEKKISGEELFDYLDSLRQNVKLPEYIVDEDTLEAGLEVAGQSYEEFLVQRDFEKKKYQEEIEKSVRLKEENGLLRQTMEADRATFEQRQQYQEEAYARLLAEKEAAAAGSQDLEQELQDMQCRVDKMQKALDELNEERQRQCLQEKRKTVISIVIILTLILIILFMIWGKVLWAWGVAAIGGIITVLGVIGDIHGGLSALSEWKKNIKGTHSK